ncbi:hypothetical protein GALMADRAFT_124495 [Galerina marginata CBS 339.88]|uniref:Uncharacterized protein n=1 Tax=Galerina marginata (strain CBS 339.88) TaxID=685588 RepID=A0A067SR55_GALM3|nr:hypothetical protein GALMADRAFT_124495 [Galerina marginata CBS 339.88]
MSLSDLLALSGVPGLSAGVKILESTYIAIENVKLYKQQCKDISARCVKLMVALQDSSKGLEGTKAIEIADEIEVIINHIYRKVREWSSWSQLKSFLQKKEIKDGIDRLHRDIDAAMMKFNIQMNMEMTRGHLESKAINERDKAEIREVLHIIVKSTDDMKALLSMQSSVDSRPVEQMMESLQTELRDPSLQPSEEEVFKAGLWMLHEETSQLPPLTDLTGQVTLSSQSTVAKGSFNDIYLGQWLDKEPRFQREVSIWRELHHPNVVPLYGVIYIDEDLYSVSPWMDNGTAVAFVKKFPSADRMKILTDAASGLEYLHSRGIVHGDLRGANVLISKNGTARLSDFGLSKFLEDCGKAATATHSMNPRWFAPELLHSAPVSTHSDVWSFGMVCLEILSGELPYSHITRDIAVLRELDNGKLPERPGRIATSQGLSDDMWDLMEKCWQTKPASRPSISDIKVAMLEMRDSPSVSSWTRFIPRKDSRPSTAPRPPTTPKLSIVQRPPTAPTVSPKESFTRPLTSGSDTSAIPRPITAPTVSHRQSFTRPSTSGSDASAISLIPSSRPRNPSIRSNGSRENDELSPLGISPSGGFIRNVMEPLRRRQNSGSSSSSTPTVTVDPEPSPTLQSSPRSASRIDGPPRLEVPSSSSFSLPAQLGTYFPPEQFFSYDRSVSSPRSIRSMSSSHLSDSVREAVSDPRLIVNVVNGVVSTGTLEGLVHRLITNFNLRSDIEYRDILLTACADFTTPEDLFVILSRRFHEAEARTEDHPEDRVAVQYNIFMVVMYWLSQQYLQVDNQLLWQMKQFCQDAIRMKSSTTMVDKARDLLQLVENREHRDRLSPRMLAPGRKLLQASQIKPQDLAIALTLLEGDKYKALVPSDYIAHLRRHPGYNNVEGAYTTNNKIILWVKDSILHDDSAENRAAVLKFFIHTAMECRKLRNFSSLVAIATALHSSVIEQLRLTKSQLTLQLQGKLDSLYDIINPSSNHQGYRQALNEMNSAEERDRCIPWLAVHLKELHLILQRYPPTVQVDGRPLINFERYLKFMERVKAVVYYRAPDLERYRQQGQLDYLENQLRLLEVSNTSDDHLMARSKKLVAQEVRDFQSRKPQLKTLGFKT